MAAAKKKAAAKAGRAAKRREDDDYGAAGGMPFSGVSAVLGDRSVSRSSARELSWADFDQQVQALARAAVAFKPQAVVGLAPSGVFPGGAVASVLKVEFFPVRLAPRSRDSQTRRRSGVADEMPAELARRRVLIVDDVCASGESLEVASRLAKAAGAKGVKTASLVTRTRSVAPDFTAYVSDTFFVFPWDYQPVVEDERFDQEARKSKTTGTPARSNKTNQKKKSPARPVKARGKGRSSKAGGDGGGSADPELETIGV